MDLYYRINPAVVMTPNNPSGFSLINSHSLKEFRVNSMCLQLLSCLDNWRPFNDIVGEQSRHSAESIRSNLEALCKLELVDKRKISEIEGETRGADALSNIERVIQRGMSCTNKRTAQLRHQSSDYSDCPSLGSVPLSKDFLPLDISLQQVLNKRSSKRNFSSEALTLAQVSTLLYHTYAEQSADLMSSSAKKNRRVTPSAGACYPLTLYLQCNYVYSLQQGLYSYNPLQHRLDFLGECKKFQRKAWQWANQSLGIAAEQKAALILFVCARFNKTLMRYGAAGYSLILKDTGALYQSIYLVSNALNLACCAVGGCMEDELAQKLGIDSGQEGQVGGLVIGIGE